MNKTGLLISTVTSSLILLANIPLAAPAYAQQCASQDQSLVDGAEEAVLGVVPRDADPNSAPMSFRDIARRVPMGDAIVRCALDALVSMHRVVRYHDDHFLVRMDGRD